MKLADREQALVHVQRQMLACRMCQRAGFSVSPSAVFSGNARAQIMVVGQAPGVTECETGRPFNAGSGSRLFSWLAAAGIDEAAFRAGQYMTSVTKCYPGRVSAASGDRVPSREEQRLCEPFLKTELELVRPKLILPVGRLAIGRFLGPSVSLEHAIGRAFQVGQATVIPLPHPSGASRWHQSPANRKKIDRAVDLLRARIS